ncbi:MAG TPA: hypothetical protein VJK72_01165 [Candidatus Nanoarchaeia archaeon]|nr:hypothetical protein [Candidatus Nanoarchaeia archaeon]
MSLQDKVECLSEVFGIENKRVIPVTHFYCVPTSDAQNIAHVRVLVDGKLEKINSVLSRLKNLKEQRSIAEKEADEKVRKEKLEEFSKGYSRCLREATRVTLIRDDILNALEAEYAAWNEFEMSGLPLRAPFGTLSQLMGTTHRLHLSSVDIRPKEPEEFGEHRKAFLELANGIEKYVRFEDYVPTWSTGGKVSLEVKNIKGGYTIRGSTEKIFNASNFNSMSVQYMCTVVPYDNCNKGRIRELNIDVDISGRGTGAHRYWTRFYLLDHCAHVRVSKTSLNPYVKHECDNPIWETSPTICDKNKAVKYVREVRNLIDALNSAPIDEKRLDRAVTDTKSSVDGKKGWFRLW